MSSTNSTTIALLKKYNFPIQKRYGQNFLIDDNILKGIVEAAGVNENDTVLEIGPGLGALTGYLCRAAKKVIAVEIDKMLVPILNETLADYENFTLINDDILKVDIEELVRNIKIKVVANLPYYITTPIIMELLEKQSCIESITVMVQKEVALRMAEGPGSKDYGALSLAVQYYSKPSLSMMVSKNCFLPKPDVDSAVVHLDVYEKNERPVKVKDAEKMFAIIKAGFGQRRKTLLNSLSNDASLGLSKDMIRDALLKMGLPETVRAEALSLEQFAALSDIL